MRIRIFSSALTIIILFFLVSALSVKQALAANGTISISGNTLSVDVTIDQSDLQRAEIGSPVLNNDSSCSRLGVWSIYTRFIDANGNILDDGNGEPVLAVPTANHPTVENTFTYNYNPTDFTNDGVDINTAVPYFMLSFDKSLTQGGCPIYIALNGEDDMNGYYNATDYNDLFQDGLITDPRAPGLPLISQLPYTFTSMFVENKIPDTIAIESDDTTNGDNEIFTVNSDGSLLQLLTASSGNNTSPIWSPDGTKILFDSDRDGNNEVYVMNADGSNQTNVTNNTANDEEASWSPDGTKIVFSSDRSGSFEIYSMNADGTNVQQLTSFSVTSSYPHYSPDGTKIVFDSNKDGTNFQIYSMNVDGSNVQQLTTSQNNIQPSYSPDGTKIVFTQSSTTTANNNIYVMNADGSNEQNITNDTSDNKDPLFSPDGSQIAFDSNRYGSIEGDTNDYATYTIDSDGSHLHEITDPISYTANITTPATDNWTFNPSWKSIASTPTPTPSPSPSPTPTPTNTPTPTPSPTPMVTTLTPVADSFIQHDEQNSNEGASPFLELSVEGKERALIQFDESQIQQAVNNDPNYTAILQLTIVSNNNKWGTTGRQIDVNRMEQAWTEGNGSYNYNGNRGIGSGVTWDCSLDSNINNQSTNCSGSTAWNMIDSASYPFNGTNTATGIMTNNHSTTISFNVTSDVRSFINGTANDGWIVRKDDETADGDVQFGSKESIYAPKLIITQQ